MRLNVNLATQPYEDARRFLIAWASVLGALLLLVIVLTVGVIRHWQEYRQMSGNIARERNILQDLDTKQQQGLAILNRPENRDVREKSDFINALIRRKQVSWTKIFTDLEQLMPSHLRVLGIEPVVKDDKIIVQMLLGGDSRDRAAELVRRMEKSRVFSNAVIVTESNAPTQPGQPDNNRYEISAEYMPGESLAKPDAKHEAASADSGGGQ